MVPVLVIVLAQLSYSKWRFGVLVPQVVEDLIWILAACILKHNSEGTLLLFGFCGQEISFDFSP